MRNLIITESLPPQFRWDPTFPVRGTEKFYMETAKSMVRAGHQVYIEGDFLTPSDWRRPLPEGIEIIRPADRQRVKPHWVMVCNPRSSLEPIRTEHHINVVWSNLDFPSQTLWDWFRTIGADSGSVITTISPYQQRRYEAAAQAWGLRTRVVPHGVDPKVFYTPPAGTDRRGVLFTSSPDRGLAVLERIWDEYELDPDLLMSLEYGHRSFTDDDVADALRQAAFWVHPGVGTELYCLAAAEAQACGATPVVVPNGALADTVRFGYRVPEVAFAQTLVAVLMGDATVPGIDRVGSGIQTWDEVTQQLMAETILAGRSK